MPGELATFATVRGHDAARDFLCRAFENDRLAHALLFAGAEGIGKRKLARAFAAWLQCDARAADACGECPSCRQVAADSHPDVKQLGIPEKKKEIGVDRAREIKRFTQLRPAGGKVKVAIVDSAHALTVAAQNALLKTLEDPPNRSILILVANNPDALLATVRSRCQRVKFQPLPSQTVADLLRDEHGVDPATAAHLAAVAEGSPGRALTLRKHLGEEIAALPERFAGLAELRYVELMDPAADLSQPEAGLGAKLEVVLAQMRDAAAASARSGDPSGAERWLRRAEVVAEVADTLRHRAANKQLLLDGLMLRLARC